MIEVQRPGHGHVYGDFIKIVDFTCNFYTRFIKIKLYNCYSRTDIDMIYSLSCACDFKSYVKREILILTEYRKQTV